MLVPEFRCPVGFCTLLAMAVRKGANAFDRDRLVTTKSCRRASPDRAHRIGQDKPVMVYRIVAQNTIEEEILRLHETKRDLVAGILDGSHAAAKLSTTYLISLIRT